MDLRQARDIWECLRKNKLAITVHNDYGHIVDKSCEARNFFATEKGAVTSITFRKWAKVTL